MFYSRLLMLNSFIVESKLIKLQNYLASLTPNNVDKITLSKIVKEIECSEEEAALILDKCLENGLMGISFGVRCPECGMLIKKINSDNIKDISIYECYNCGEEIKISEDDIVALFSLKVDIPPFDSGQREVVAEPYSIFQVARSDTIKALEIFGFNEKVFKEFNIDIKNKDLNLKKQLLQEKRKLEIKIDRKVKFKYIRNIIIFLVAVSIIIIVAFVFCCYIYYKCETNKLDRLDVILGVAGIVIVPSCITILKIFISIDKDRINQGVCEKYKYQLEDIKIEIEEISNNFR